MWNFHEFEVFKIHIQIMFIIQHDSSIGGRREVVRSTSYQDISVKIYGEHGSSNLRVQLTRLDRWRNKVMDA